MAPATDMTPPQVAKMLGCSAPTVRGLIEDRLLPATTKRKGDRTFHTVSSADVDAYVAEHGTFTERRRRPASPRSSDGGIEAVVEELRSLRQLVERRAEPSSEARAEVVALGEAVQLQRAVMAALLEADDLRSAGVKFMRQAMEAFEDADAKRKEAIRLLDEVLGSLTLPGTTASLTNPMVG